MKLKDYLRREGITVDDIVDQMKENGDSVARSTMFRIVSDGHRPKNRVLGAIAAALGLKPVEVDGLIQGKARWQARTPYRRPKAKSKKKR